MVPGWNGNDVQRLCKVTGYPCRYTPSGIHKCGRWVSTLRERKLSGGLRYEVKMWSRGSPNEACVRGFSSHWGVFSPCITGAWLLRGKDHDISNSALSEWLPQSHSNKTRFGEHLSQGDQREYKRKVNVQGQLIRTIDLCIARLNNIT